MPLRKYTVLHPVQHDKPEPYPRGAEISLADADAQRLLDRGVITPGKPVVAAGPSAAEALAYSATLQAMEKAALIEYAQSKYDLALASDDKKEAMIDKIHNRYIATFVPAA